MGHSVNFLLCLYNIFTSHLQWLFIGFQIQFKGLVVTCTSNPWVTTNLPITGCNYSKQVGHRTDPVVEPFLWWSLSKSPRSLMVLFGHSFWWKPEVNAYFWWNHGEMWLHAHVMVPAALNVAWLPSAWSVVMQLWGQGSKFQIQVIRNPQLGLSVLQTVGEQLVVSSELSTMLSMA